jgi:hypothetical protein
MIKMQTILVSKLCLGTDLLFETLFLTGARELPGQAHSQTEFGNEEDKIGKRIRIGRRL